MIVVLSFSLSLTGMTQKLEKEEVARLVHEDKATVDLIERVDKEVLLGRFEDETTLLHFVRNPEVAQYLIDCGAPLDAQDRQRQTPLHYASLENQAPIVEVLIRNGAQVDPRDHQGQTPLHCTCIGDNAYIAEILLRNGAHIDTEDNNDNTPLHLAASHGFFKTTMTLLNFGARAGINPRYPNRLSPESIAEDGLVLRRSYWAFLFHKALCCTPEQGKQARKAILMMLCVLKRVGMPKDLHKIFLCWHEESRAHLQTLLVSGNIELGALPDEFISCFEHSILDELEKRAMCLDNKAKTQPERLKKCVALLDVPSLLHQRYIARGYLKAPNALERIAPHVTFYTVTASPIILPLGAALPTFMASDNALCALAVSYMVYYGAMLKANYAHSRSTYRAREQNRHLLRKMAKEMAFAIVFCSYFVYINGWV